MAFLVVFVLFCACIAVLLFYHLYFHLRIFSFKKSPERHPKAPVSVIVVANNEFKSLVKLIPVLLTQDYPTFEIILVDDRSYDETYEHFLAFSKTESRLKFLRVDETIETSSAKKFALTLAIKAAKYDDLVFIDADCMPTSEFWLHGMAFGFVNKKQITIGISPYQEEKTFLNKLIQFETGLTALNYISFALANIPYMAVGRNWGFKKQLFIDTKGYHPFNKIKGGDDDLFLQKIATAQNTSIVLDPSAYVVSAPKTTWTDWLEQKKRHYSVSKYYIPKIKFLLGLFHTSHFLAYILFIALLFSQEFRLYSSALFMLRLIIFWVSGSKAFRLLEAKVKWYFIPLFELTYSFTVITFGLLGLKAKKIKWR